MGTSHDSLDIEYGKLTTSMFKYFLREQDPRRTGHEAWIKMALDADVQTKPWRRNKLHSKFDALQHC